MKILKYALPIFFLVAVIFGCEKETPTAPEAPIPEITSIEPDSAYGGDAAIITGSNFNPDPEKNLIRFGYNPAFGYVSVRANSGNETTLKFIIPKTVTGVGEIITPEVKVTREDCKQWSNGIAFSALPLISIFAEDFGQAHGIEFDQDGNCYVSDPGDEVIWKITPDGEREVYAEVGWCPGDIVFDRDGYLYVCTCWDGLIVRVPLGGGEPELFTDEIPGPMGLDWDENGNMYVVSVWDEGLWRITPEGEITHLDNVEVQHGGDVMVYEGYLYWGEAGDLGEGENAIKRAPITPDGLGAPEIVYEDPNWSGTYIWGPHGINIDIEGNVYAVSRYPGDGSPNLSRFNTDGTAEVIAKLPTTNNKYIAFWGEDAYVTWHGNSDEGEPGVVYKVHIGKEGAPPYAWGE